MPPAVSASANKAVFLSYAAQDAETALRICEALRAAGVEVWFDQSELRGGAPTSWPTTLRSLCQP
ncbi:MAG: TIR domain-containing protein [Opitutus sp.]|nr:TIR domain-containing protein [Opitutus sp.]